MAKRPLSAMEQTQLQYSSTATSRRMPESNNVKAPVGGINPSFGTGANPAIEGSRGVNPTIGSAREYAQPQSASAAALAAASRRTPYSNIVKTEVGGSYSGQPLPGKPPGSGTDPTSSERSRGVNPTIGGRNPQEHVAQQPCSQPPPPSSNSNQQSEPKHKLFDGPYFVEGWQEEALADIFALWTGVASKPISDSWKTNTAAQNIDEGFKCMHKGFKSLSITIQKLSRELVYILKNFVPKQKYDQLQAKYYLLQDKYDKLQALHTQDVQALHAAANESINTLKASLEKTSSRASEAR